MQARLHELLELARLEAVPFERAPAAWHGAWYSLSYQPAAYSRATLDYQRTYLRGTGRRIDAFDLVLLHDGRPCGLWPLMLSRADSMQGSLSSCGKAVYPPLLHLDLAPRGQGCTRRGELTLESREPVVDETVVDGHGGRSPSAGRRGDANGWGVGP